MIHELINKTKQKEFYSNFSVELKGFQSLITSHRENELTLTISIIGTSGLENEKTEFWKITALNVSDYRLRINPVVLPYNQLDILNNHPLLWDFHFDELECEISGNIKDFCSFKERLDKFCLENFYGWDSFNLSLTDIKSLSQGESIEVLMNRKVYDKLTNFIKSSSINISILSVTSGIHKGVMYRPKSKLFIFCNFDFDSIHSYGSQNYIIADGFDAVKI